MKRRERLAFILPPAAAMATVALGLRIGAGEGVRAALVQGAPAAGAAGAAETGVAWSIAVFEEDGGVREPVAGLNLDVAARTDGASCAWHGTTNDDGIAEANLALPGAPTWLEVRSGPSVLARGAPAVEPPTRPGRAVAGFLPFTRREGNLALDVLVSGARVAPAFPAALWARATDAATGAPQPGVTLTVERDTALAAVTDARAPTDSAGWGALTVTPVGLAVPLAITARAADGRTGRWSGGLFMSPGAPRLDAAPRFDPTATPVFTIEAPPARREAYVEVDDARGRAWATTLPLAASETATVRAPVLAPGFYWTVVAASAGGAAELGAGSMVRPFFVAPTGEAALAFGTDRATCTPPRDARELPRAIGTCLAASAITPVPRWLALDGFTERYAARAVTRTRGLVVAVGALVIAALLETALLLRAAAMARAGLRVAADAADADGGHGDAIVTRRGARTHVWTVTVAVLVGLLGFALLAAFVLRVA